MVELLEWRMALYKKISVHFHFETAAEVCYPFVFVLPSAIGKQYERNVILPQVVEGSLRSWQSFGTAEEDTIDATGLELFS